MKKRKKISSNAYLKKALMNSTADAFDDRYPDEDEKLLEEIKLEINRHYALTYLIELKISQLRDLTSFLMSHKGLRSDSKRNIWLLDTQFTSVVFNHLQAIAANEYVLHVNLDKLDDMDGKVDHFNEVTRLVDGLKGILQMTNDYRKRLVERYVPRLGLRDNRSLLFQSESANEEKTLYTPPAPAEDQHDGLGLNLLSFS